MNIFAIDLADVVLGLMLFLVLTLVLTIFLHYKKASLIAGATVVVIILLTGYMEYRDQFTTFDDLAEEQLDEDRLRWMTITTYDLTSDTRNDMEKQTRIYDEEIIERVLDDFSGMELKLGDNRKTSDWKYGIQVTSTSHFTFYADKDYVDQFQIQNDTDHLNTIEDLLERDDIEWEKFNE